MLNMLSISSTGLQDAMLRMSAVSQNVSAASQEPPVEVSGVHSAPVAHGKGVNSLSLTRESVFGVDLVSEAVHLKMAERGFEANAKAVMVADSVLGTIINMVDTEK